MSRIKKVLTLFLCIFASVLNAEDFASDGQHWDWWNQNAGSTNLIATFKYMKRLSTMRKPIRLKGEFFFRKSDTSRHLLMNVYRLKEGELDHQLLVDDKRWWTYMPDVDGSNGVLEKVDLTVRPEARGALHSLLLFYASTTSELEKTFQIKLTQIPDENKAWSFTLIPLKRESLKYLKAVEISMKEKNIHSIKFVLPKKRESIFFEFESIKEADLSKDDLEINVPEGTRIKVVQDDKEKN